MTLQMGKLLRQLRIQQGLTQRELCNGIVSKSVLSRIESGMLEPNVFIMNELLDRLGKSLKYFEIMVSNKEYERIKHGEYAVPLHTTVIEESDYFKDIRTARGLSQEQFSYDVCARETISNIEHGRTPNYKKMRLLMEKLEVPFEKYNGFVIAQEYEVYELVAEYQNVAERNPEEAEQLRNVLAGKLDNNLPVNRQFLESSELMERRRKGLLTPGEELAGLERCLRYTMPEYDEVLYRIPYRQEVVILKKIADCLEEVKRGAAAQELRDLVMQKEGKKLKVS